MVPHLQDAGGYSFPSGHTSGSLVVYGMLAYLCLRLLPPRWHLASVLLASALAFSIGWSRVILQVHWASDVVAGFAFGVAWLTVSIAAIEVTRRMSRRPTASRSRRKPRCTASSRRWARRS